MDYLELFFLLGVYFFAIKHGEMLIISALTLVCYTFLKERGESVSVKQKQLLLSELMKSSAFQPASFLAKKIQSSKRTVYLYLDELEEAAEKVNARLERKTGLGIRLNADNYQKQSLKKIMESQALLDMDPKSRQVTIIKRLLEGKTLSYSKLAEEFYVSRSTLVKDMKLIKSDYFPGDSALTSSNEGTCLTANERTVQSLWRNYLSKQYSLSRSRLPLNVNEYSQFIQKELQLDDKDSQFILECLDSLGVRFELAEYYRLQLLEYLSVFIYRLKHNHHHQHSAGYIFERVSTLDTYYIAFELAGSIQNNLSVTLTTEDTIFLNDCLIASGIKNQLSTDNYAFYEQIATDLIRKIGTMMNEDLTDDSILKTGLINHLMPMCFRLKNKLSLQNPYIKEIKKQYSMMFHLTWYGVVDLEQHVGTHIPEDEVAFLMIHFQSALERKRDIRKILIVTQTGMVTTEILIRRIKQFLPSVHVYESMQADKLESVDLNKVDLIISSENLPVKTPPVHLLSVIPSDEELKGLANQLPLYFEQTDLQAEKNGLPAMEHPLIDSLSKRLSIVRGTFSYFEEVIEHLSSPLVEQGYVSEEYVSTIYEREAMSSTAFEAGIAIPHGNPSFVNQTHISVCITDRKIVWGDERVDVIVLISVAKEDMEHISLFIERIYDVMQSREKVERVFTEQSNQALYRYFAGY